MSTAREGGPGSDEASRNRVLLRGRVSSPPEQRELPSGTSIVWLRISVARDPTPMTRGSRQTTDWVDLSAWGARTRRTVSSWRAGDVVEVEGSLRRRFHRGGQGTSTRLEVEVLGGRLLARAATPSARGARRARAREPGGAGGAG